MGPKQVLRMQVRVDLGVMVMKDYSIFPKDSGVESHHQIHFSVILKTLIGVLASVLYRFSRQDRKATGFLSIYYSNIQTLKEPICISISGGLSDSVVGHERKSILFRVCLIVGVETF